MGVLALEYKLLWQAVGWAAFQDLLVKWEEGDAVGGGGVLAEQTQLCYSCSRTPWGKRFCTGATTSAIWMEGPCFVFLHRPFTLRCWHSQLGCGGTLIRRAMYEAAVCGPTASAAPVNKWNLSTKKKVRLYFITQILFLYPRNCSLVLLLTLLIRGDTLFSFFS